MVPSFIYFVCRRRIHGDQLFDQKHGIRFGIDDVHDAFELQNRILSRKTLAGGDCGFILSNYFRIECDFTVTNSVPVKRRALSSLRHRGRNLTFSFYFRCSFWNRVLEN